MFGKPEWFGRRKYTGWGLSPRTWQGWVYLAVLILPVIIVQALSLAEEWKLYFTIFWVVIFAIDLISIMRRLPKDERDRAHEAIAERNAIWALLAVLIAGLLYQTAGALANGEKTIDPVIIIALIAATVTKAISNYYLEKRD